MALLFWVRMAVSNALSNQVQVLLLVGENLMPPFQNRLFRAWRVKASALVPRILVVRSNRLLVSVRARVLTPLLFQVMPPPRKRQSVAANTAILLPPEKCAPELASRASSVKRSRASGKVEATRSSAKRAVLLVEPPFSCTDSTRSS